MTNELIIQDNVGDPAISEIIKKHSDHLRGSGIEKMEINPHRQYMGGGNPPLDGVELQPGKKSGSWTGDTTGAVGSMKNLEQEIIERLGVPTKVEMPAVSLSRQRLFCPDDAWHRACRSANGCLAFRSPTASSRAKPPKNRFRSWLDRCCLPHIYVEQSPFTIPEPLRGEIKRPDFLVGIPVHRHHRRRCQSQACLSRCVDHRCLRASHAAELRDLLQHQRLVRLLPARRAPHLPPVPEPQPGQLGAVEPEGRGRHRRAAEDDPAGR